VERSSFFTYLSHSYPDFTKHATDVNRDVVPGGWEAKRLGAEAMGLKWNDVLPPSTASRGRHAQWFAPSYSLFPVILGLQLGE
jgi:hypothetical protein